MRLDAWFGFDWGIFCFMERMQTLENGIIPNWLNRALAALGPTFSPMPLLWSTSLGGCRRRRGSVSRVAYGDQEAQRIDALGLGNVKFGAAARLWVGHSDLFALVKGACVLALSYVLARRLNGGCWLRARIPLGPVLAASPFTTVAYRGLA